MKATLTSTYNTTTASWTTKTERGIILQQIVYTCFHVFYISVWHNYSTCQSKIEYMEKSQVTNVMICDDKWYLYIVFVFSFQLDE